VFEIKNTGTVAAPVYAGAPTTLATFNGTDLAAGWLTADANGNLFGTTEVGGVGGGTVFEIQNTGTRASPVYASAPTTLITLSGTPPGGVFLDASGDLFGTTSASGGNGNYGTVFEIQNTGTRAAPVYASAPTTLVTFNGSNGENLGGLTADANGDLFGAAYGGGASNRGTVFEIQNTGTVAAPVYASTPTTLVTFNGTNGQNPQEVIIDANGDLFGTTFKGGANGDGTVFEVQNVGTRAAPVYASTPITLVSFNGTNGSDPLAGLTADANGDLFGTTFDANGDGTVFEITNSGFAATARPTIAGTVSDQTTTMEAPLDPFAKVTIGDANAGATDTLTISLSNGGAGGTLSGAGLSGGTGGVYTLSGTAATVTNELDALSFKPVVGQPNASATTTFNLSDLSSACGTPATDSTTTVTDVDPAVAPTIAGTVSGQTTTMEAPFDPFAKVTIGDANAGATDKVTITLGGAGGSLADGPGFTGLTTAGLGVYTLTGSASTISNELDALVFTPKAGAPNTSSTTTFTLSDQSSAYATPTADYSTSVIDRDPASAPTIGGTHPTSTTSEAPVDPFLGVAITDPNVGATDTLTIRLSGIGGRLADGTGFTGLGSSGGGVYALSGTASAVTSQLDALVFTPAAGAPGTSTTTTFTLSDQSSAYATATVDSTTSVIDSDPAVAPTISGTVGSLTTTMEAPLDPFAEVTIGDANAGATDTLTITLGGAGGSLADGPGFSGLTTAGPGVYTLSGTASAISNELDALVFAPKAGAPNTSSTTTFTLSDQSSAYATPTADSTTSVIDSDPAVAPTIGGTHATSTTSEAPVDPFSGVAITDPNAGGTETLTIRLSGGGGTLADGTGFSGLVSSGGGVYALSGTASAVTSELDALVFTPATGAPGTSTTTTFTLSDQSSAYASAVTAGGTTVSDIDPTPPAITSASYVGTGTSGHWSLSGTAAAGSTVTVYDGASVLGATLATTSGTWGLPTAENNTAIRDYTASASNTSARSAPYFEGTPSNDVFNFASEAALSAAALINGGSGTDTVQLTSPATLSDADFAHFQSIEILGLTGASSVALATNAGNNGLGTVIVGSGNTSIADSNSGKLAVNATALGPSASLTLAGSTADTVTTGSGNIAIIDNASALLAVNANAMLAANMVTLTGTGPAAVSNLKGALNASGDSGAINMTAKGTTQQSVNTGSGDISIADSTAGGSVAVNASALGGMSTLTLTGSRPEAVSNFVSGAIDASGLTGALNVTAGGSGSMTTGAGGTTITDNATGALTLNDGTGVLTLTGAAGSTTVNTGSANTSIVDNATGAMTVNALAMSATHSLTLSGTGAASVTNLQGNLAAGVDNGALNVTATGTSAQTIRTGSGADTITAAHGGDTIQGGGGGDTINVSGHTTADTFVYAATSDSLNSTTGHDTISGFIGANGNTHDLLSFSQINKGLHIQGPVASGSTIAADTIAWVNLGASAMVYVNDTGGALASNSASLMEMTLNGVTGSLSASNFKA
jgi:uncharacterized repeat protein (TIGR03803 family)